MEKQTLIIRNEFDLKSFARSANAIDITTPKKIVITDYKLTRSDAQNKLMWKWNSEFQRFMFEHHGQVASAEEWHEILVEKLCPVKTTEVKLPTGETLNVGRARTSKFNTSQMTEYLEKLDYYCSSLGLMLPHPDDLMMAIYGRRAA